VLLLIADTSVKTGISLCQQKSFFFIPDEVIKNEDFCGYNPETFLPRDQYLSQARSYFPPWQQMTM
jgi:hypothetical protein